MKKSRREKLRASLCRRRAKLEKWLGMYHRLRDSGRVAIAGVSESFIHYVVDLARVDQRLAALREDDES